MNDFVGHYVASQGLACAAQFVFWFLDYSARLTAEDVMLVLYGVHNPWE